MSTTGPYLPSLFVAGSKPTADALNQLVRAIRYWQGEPLSGDEERPQAYLYQTVAQSLGGAAASPIAFDAEQLDTAGGHSTTVNTSRWTCPASKQGEYAAEYQAAFSTNATGDRAAWMRVNGSHVFGLNMVPAAGSHQTVLSGAAGIYLAAGDYVELVMEQYSGGSLNTDITLGSFLSLRQTRVQ